MKKVYRGTVWLPIISSAHEGRIVARCDIRFDIEAVDEDDACRQIKNIAEGLHTAAPGERTPNGDPTRSWALRQTGTLYLVTDAPAFAFFGDGYGPGAITAVTVSDYSRTIRIRFVHQDEEQTATYAMWGGKPSEEWECSKRHLFESLNINPQK